RCGRSNREAALTSFLNDGAGPGNPMQPRRGDARLAQAGRPGSTWSPNPGPAPQGRQTIAKGVSPGKKPLATHAPPGIPGLAPFAILCRPCGAKTKIVWTNTQGFRPGLVSGRPFGAAFAALPPNPAWLCRSGRAPGSRRCQ